MWSSILSVVPTVTFFVLHLAGLVLACVWYRRHPRVSLWAGAGFLAFMLADALSGGMQAYLIYTGAGGTRVGELGLILMISSTIGFALRLSGTGALMVGVFGWRARE